MHTVERQADLRPRRQDGDGDDDGDLVRRVRAGDPEAFAQLYRRHERAVSGVVRRSLGRGTECDDLVQDVFVAAWRKLATLRDPQCFRPWLLQIARMASIDDGRRRQLARSRACTDGEPHVIPDERPSPEELVELADLVRLLGDKIALLSAREAAALTLVAQLGFGSDDVASALGVSPGNARIILHRARKRLRSAISAGNA